LDAYLIQAVALRKRFGENQAVDDLDLHVSPGEIYGLVGADGAGKTTSMRLLVGALLPDSGEVEICGYDLRRQTEMARANIGYLSQQFSMYEDLTVLENIRFFAELRGLKRREWLSRCTEILEFVGLAAFKDRHAGQLSGGMRQKLGLASALVTRPRVLLLDEPTTGVDPVTRQDFWQLLLRLVSENGESHVAVLITTPYMDEAARCHKVGFMKKGRIIAEGTPKELREQLRGRILELVGEPLQLLRQITNNDPGIENVRAFGDRLHIRIRPEQAKTVMARLDKAIPAGGGRLDSARIIPPLLEDVFINLDDQTE
jgi:ABC-2 type transport system ATP-binding protein